MSDGDWKAVREGLECYSGGCNPKGYTDALAALERIGERFAVLSAALEAVRGARTLETAQEIAHVATTPRPRAEA